MTRVALSRSPWTLAASALLACSPGTCGDGAEPAASTPVALTESPPKPAQATAAEAAEEEPEAKKWPKPGFSELTLIDQVPICLFPTYDDHAKAKFVDQVRRKRLRAGRTVIFGAFAPWCVHPDCDQRPSLQCTVDREGNELTVHTKYWGDHKDGSACSSDCYPINAGCQSPELEPGKYVVHHGELSFELKIPGTPPTVCFGEPLPPGA